MQEEQNFMLLKPGTELASLTLTVTPELNQQWLYAMEDFHPRYIEENVDGAPLVHPALLLLMSFPSKSSSFILPAGWAPIHAADEAEFLHPARVGSKLLVRWSITRAWEKRGRQYQEIAARITDEQGYDILHRSVSITYTMATQTTERNQA
ncbi:MAG: MaoC family dehydratase N-terminal domain-containing protein [Ktedonobacteraceae bacterium]|nr:MaoC family dehydratase N-terminal domain-containing protein [Ktedonobacteraceae bacterium]